MNSIDLALSPLSEADHRAQLRRAVIASTVGTAIEWYDFLLYGQMTALVFGKLFFPKSDPLVGVLEAFAVYFVGFLARPIGAVIFGHFGDRVGRKGALIATLLMSGLACFAVGFVPTYASIGIWGAVLLTIIRFIQGVGVGGEWGGSVALSMEWARTNAHRGFITSWPQLGVSAGFFLANLAGLVFSAISGDQFLVWGWRIPFFLSILMVCVGLYIRLGILETPPFRRLLAENRIERVPVLEAIKREPKSIILTACARMGGVMVLCSWQGSPIGVAYASSLLSLEHGGASGWIEELYVLPQWRGRRIGSRLIAEVVARAKESGWRALDLEVEASHQRALQPALMVRRPGATTTSRPETQRVNFDCAKTCLGVQCGPSQASLDDRTGRSAWVRS